MVESAVITTNETIITSTNHCTYETNGNWSLCDNSLDIKLYKLS